MLPDEETELQESDIVTIDLDAEDDGTVKPEAAPEESDRDSQRKERGMDRDAMSGMVASNAKLAAENEALRSAARPPPAPSPAEQGISSSRREIQAIHTRYAAKDDWTQAETDTIQAELSAAEGRLMDHEFDKRAAARGYAPAPTQAQTAQTALEAQYPDIYRNPQALKYAEGLYAKEIHGGATEGRELHDKVIEQARVDMGLTKRPKPSEATKSRTSGESKGGNAGSGAPKPKTFEMGKKQRELARALYPKDPDKVAFQKWAKRVGAKVK